MTISVERETAAAIQREAKQDGVDISTWLARTAKREATRRAYARAGEERQAAGVDTAERLAALAARRASVRHHYQLDRGRRQEDGPAGA